MEQRFQYLTFTETNFVHLHNMKGKSRFCGKVKIFFRQYNARHADAGRSTVQKTADVVNYLQTNKESFSLKVQNICKQLP